MNEQEKNQLIEKLEQEIDRVRYSNDLKIQKANGWNNALRYAIELIKNN